MGKVNKDYCHEYRKRHLEEYREADKLRKKNKRLKDKLLNPEVHREKKKEDALRKKIFRERKKLGFIKPKKKLDDPVDIPCEPNLSKTSNPVATSETSDPVATSTPQSTPKQVAQSSFFATKQSKCRSINRAKKALPTSPNKRKEVVGALSERFALRIAMKKKPGPKKSELTTDEEKWLHEFLDRGDISYVNPGRADNVYVGKREGKRQYIQKRFLLWTLRDLNAIINGFPLKKPDDDDVFDNSDLFESNDDDVTFKR